MLRGRIVDGLRRALSFLTVCPLRASDAWTPETLGSSMTYYPLVGTCIGLALWCLYAGLSLLCPPAVVLVLVLGASLLLTGGLHLDGFADTVDGLCGGYTREDTLRIFKDPRVGPMAAGSVAMLVLLKYACLAALVPEALRPTLVLMATLSRYSMVQLACFSPYARATGGLGEPFVRGIQRTHLLGAVGLTLGSALLFGGWRGLLMGLLVSLGTLGLHYYFRHRLGGVTGDVLGATNECSEALVLVLATMLY